jgi:glycosyltransferase involved in cell wall biosynthesis
MLISLIVATLDRVQEVKTLLDSLCDQSFQDFEIIIVDQNADDRLSSLADTYTGRLRLQRLRSHVRKLSHARNVGIAAATGGIIGFPDDDCLYPPDVLSRVDRAFNGNSELAVLSGPAFSPEGKPGSGRWQSVSGPIGIDNVWTTVIAFNLFIRHAALQAAGGFDESFGVGARFGSAEETDLVIRILRAGGNCQYDFDLRVIHPDKALTKIAANRAFRYGTGLGRALRKHQVPRVTVANFLIRPLGGVCLNLVRRNMLAVDYYWATFRGRVSGFVASLKDSGG